MPTHIPGTPESLAIAKSQARRLSVALVDRFPLKHGQALELVAQLHGQESWGHLRSLIEGRSAPAEDVSHHSLNMSEDLGCLIEHTMLSEVFSLVLGPLPHELGPAEFAARLTLTELEHVFRDAPKYGSAIYLERVMHSDIRAAEDKAREKSHILLAGTRTSDFIARRLLSARQDPGHGPVSSASSSVVGIEAGFAAFMPYETSEVSQEQLFSGKHAWMIGEDLSRFTDRHPEALDLSGPYPADLKKLARSWTVPCPEFGSGFIGLNWLVTNKLGAILHAPAETPYYQGVRKAVVLSMSDMLRNAGADVLLAQARSMGLHVLVWVDRPDTDPYDVDKLSRNITSLIDLRNAPAITVRSRALHDTLGGKLAVAPSWRGLSLREKAGNALVRLKA